MVEGTSLLRKHTGLTLYRGFESLVLRHKVIYIQVLNIFKCIFSATLSYLFLSQVTCTEKSSPLFWIYFFQRILCSKFFKVFKGLAFYVSRGFESPPLRHKVIYIQVLNIFKYIFSVTLSYLFLSQVTCTEKSSPLF